MKDYIKPIIPILITVVIAWIVFVTTSLFQTRIDLAVLSTEVSRMRADVHETKAMLTGIMINAAADRSKDISKYIH